LIATTRTPEAFSAAMASASVNPPLGSCDDASPKKATMRVLFGRNGMIPLPIW
jgi:hypothetical protein